MSFTTFDIHQRDRWLEYLDKIDYKDIYFTPEYCHLYEKNREGQAQLIVYVEGNNFIYYPFLLREINNIPNIREIEKKYGKTYDMITPYGYGGPITNVKDPQIKNAIYYNFNKQLNDYCKKNNIITEFIRYHPIIRNDMDNKDFDSEYVRNTIYVDLTRDRKEIWAKYDTKNRNRIRKSIQYGLKVVQSSIYDLDNFTYLYYKTMEKKKAYEYYYFAPAFFENMVELLGERIELFEVLYEDKVILSCFFMCYGKNIHYHLLGSEETYLKYSPNNLLINYVVDWAKTKGFTTLHLGGGYCGEDSLYKFKKHFNKDGDIPFHIGKKIHNPQIYQEIIKDFIAIDNGFFPLYRHPSLINSSNKV